MTTKTMDVREAQSQFPELVSSVAAGEEIILTEGNTPIARLIPIASPSTGRIPGLHSGSVWVSDDFDAPLPDEYWLGEA